MLVEDEHITAPQPATGRASLAQFKFPGNCRQNSCRKPGVAGASAGRMKREAVRLPRPKAILCISLHSDIQDAAVTVSTVPSTIHDFGGLPRELFEVQHSEAEGSRA